MKDFRIRSLFIFCLVWFLFMGIQAQNPYAFTHIDTRGTQINSIFKDKYGVIWFGTTSGLMRWDDFHQENTFTRIKDRSLYSSIREIQSDSTGKLWLKTESGRYMIYDQQDHSVFSDMDSLLDEFGINHISKFEKTKLYNIYIDIKGNLWIYQNDICLFYAIGKKKLIKLEKLPSDYIQSIYVENNICYIRYSNIINTIDVKTLKPLNTILLPGKVSHSAKMLVDTSGNIWYWNRQLFLYEKEYSKWKNIGEKGISDILVSSMLFDSNGDVLIGTEHHGLLVYNVSGQLKNVLSHDSSNMTTIANNNLHVVYSDNENNLWLGYNKYGLSYSSSYAQGYYMHHLKTIFERRGKDDINTVCADKIPLQHLQELFLITISFSFYNHCFLKNMCCRHGVVSIYNIRSVKSNEFELFISFCFFFFIE